MSTKLFVTLSEAEKDTLAVIGILNCITVPISLVLNILVITPVLIKRRLRTVDSIFKVNVCVANVSLILLAQIPVIFVILLGSSQTWFRPLSKIITTVSFATVAGLMLERYISVYYPYSYHRVQEPRIVIMLISLAWLPPFIVGSSLFTRNKHSFEDLVYIMLSAMNALNSFLVVASQVRFLITIRKMQRQIEVNEERFARNNRQRVSLSRKGTRYTIIISLLFLVCHTPYSVFGLHANIMNLGPENQPYVIIFVMATLSFLPNVIIPSLIIWTTKGIREVYSQCCVHIGLLPQTVRNVP